MLQPGNYYSLPVTEQLPFGWLLGDGENTALLAQSNVGEPIDIGDVIDVFVFHDGDGRLLATFEHPKASVGQCATLTIVSVTSVGAFADWGIDKDLFIPRSLQDKPLSVGMSAVVYVAYDSTRDRIVGATKLRKYLSEDGTYFSAHQAVSLRVYDQSDMGYKAVINNSHLGLIYKDEAFLRLHIGDCIDGFVKHIREDNKIDLCLQLPGEHGRKALSEQIIEDLVAHGGVSTLTDKSPASEISHRFGVSKSAYKKALGQLYKQRQITISKDKICLTNPQ